MDNKKIRIKKRSVYTFLAIAVLVLLGLLIFNYSKISVYVTNQDTDTKELEAKFAQLSSANTNFCAGPNILDQVNADRLQGSCCSAMDFHRYKEQIEGLKEYSKYEKIPGDPYDISREWAEEMIDYNENVQLAVSQQEIYDEAMEMSMEGGPCCCKCWRWYAYGGLAKYLITEYEFNSEQIAGIWDLSDGCGGSGHVEGINEH